MTEPQEQGRIQLVVFDLNQNEFAVPIEQVWRVEPLAELTMTEVPRAPAFLEGVINLRGQVVPVLDLKKRFGLPATAWPPKARILVVDMASQRVGLMVDAVTDILWFPRGQIEPPPPMVSQVSGTFVQGVGDREGRLLTILDLQQVLDLSERQQLQEMQKPSEEEE